MSTHLTELPFGLPGKVFRSAMPYGLYDRDGQVYPAFLESNISAVVVLAEIAEIKEKSSRDLLALYRQQGINVLHLPIKDYDVPDLVMLRQTTDASLDLAREGKNIAIHCSGGIGRTGMFAACMAKRIFDLTGEQAIDWVRKYIPGAVETQAQKNLVIDF